MQRVPEVLELAVIVERGRPVILESQRLEKRDLRGRRRAAEEGVAQELEQSFLVIVADVAFAVFKVLLLSGRGANREREGRRIPVPRRDRAVEPALLFGRDVHDVTAEPRHV